MRSYDTILSRVSFSGGLDENELGIVSYERKRTINLMRLPVLSKRIVSCFLARTKRKIPFYPARASNKQVI